jgi:hypothetical protein
MSSRQKYTQEIYYNVDHLVDRSPTASLAAAANIFVSKPSCSSSSSSWQKWDKDKPQNWLGQQQQQQQQSRVHQEICNAIR